MVQRKYIAPVKAVCVAYRQLALVVRMPGRFCTGIELRQAWGALRERASRWAGPRCAGTNAMAESFWSTLKTEFYDRGTPTRTEARRELSRWIGVVCNRCRLDSALGYTTPVEYKHALRHRRPGHRTAATIRITPRPRLAKNPTGASFENGEF